MNGPSRHLVERAMEAMQGSRVAGATPRGGPGLETLTEAGEPESEAPQAPARPPVTLEQLQAAGLVGGGPGASRSRVIEELNVAQHQVLRTMQGAAPAEGRLSRLVMLTSAKPGEGKTFCSMNLAGRIALGTAERVVLVDGDGKAHGSLTHLLGLGDAPGLRRLAFDPAQRPEALLRPTAFERLSILPYGPAPEGMTDLPSGAMLVAAIQRLARACPNHVIVFDAPPCLLTSEPTALAAVAGQVVVVVRAESTQREEVEAALDMVESCPTLQLLLNQTRMSTSSSFGSYGYYGYYRG